jgi:hypothetical protein
MEKAKQGRKQTRQSSHAEYFFKVSLKHVGVGAADDLMNWPKIVDQR